MPATEPTEDLIERRRALLASLRLQANGMLAELAQVIGVDPPHRLSDEPEATLEAVAAFCRRTDFASATEDGRIWTLNRLGLYLARLFVERHGGHLHLQDDPQRPFYLRNVVVDMDPPVVPDARVDPFAIASDVVHLASKPELVELIRVAERSLVGAAREDRQ
jgi:hypothetical protein